MVAGATGIDLFLLVVDAAEGARPQTHEHLAILRLLGIERGVVAVTKADAVDAETLELAVEEARELVPGAEVVAVSAKTGAGLDELRAALGARGRRLCCSNTSSTRPTRLYVDRVFTLRGIGTVVDRDALVGIDRRRRRAPAEPARPRRARAQRPGARPRRRAGRGRASAWRVALPGVERHELRRGDALVAPGAFAPSYRLDVALEELEPIADGARLHVHHGTAAVPARVVRAGERLRAAPARGAGRRRARRPRRPPRRDDRRRRHASSTPRPPRHADPDALRAGARAARTTRARAGARRRRVAFSDDVARGARAPSWSARIDAADPLDPGVTAPTEPWARDVLARLPFERRGSKLYRPGAAASLGERAAEAAALEAELDGGGAWRGRRSTTRSSRASSSGRAGSSGSATATPSRRRPTSARGRSSSRSATAAGRIALARFRDLAGCGRRDAQLLLERLDADGVTRRVGDARVLRRSASRSA